MTHNYEEDDNAILDDDEELRTILRTPEYPEIDSTSYNDNNFNFVDFPNFTTSVSYTPSIPASNNPIQSSENVHNMHVDRNEWQITDPSSGKKRPPRQNEFLQLLLENSRYRSYISWLNETEGLFKILQPDKVVALWVKVKSRKTIGKMDYDTFARGIRYYYNKGWMIKTNKKYTFCFKRSINKTVS